MKNFDFGNLKYNYVAVHCNSQSDLDNFIKQCEENGIIVGPDRQFDKNYGYIIVDSERLYCDYVAVLKNEDYEIIEWEMESPFIENKIDYDREYNILEIMELPEETIFKCGNCEYRVKGGELEWLDGIVWKLNLMSLKQTLMLKFKPIKKDEKVSFEEAIQAYGKDIYCIWIDAADMKHKSEYRIYSNESILKDQNEDPIAPVEIFEGEWYIKEN
ncbi:hypothetical protein CF088_16230 [Clostridium botulinum]|uniref:hypothetical protein n=1 Tax=Clostridium botulinum TaxID=1491 RepID=UPI0007740E32|nr:hypothetical protein [Clostridium botulinum]APH21723.1 hypothetical protein NPD1_2876 [Clostridium botulinum]APQ68502.1 hypothetical protein RSJ8_1002 [Clostridium botulinum]MBN3380010.1 hypothetical protein [Clostridium botulinum]MBN3406786.1 hypothetical protein [Clostridium botulinum]QDY17039.1 hypothetical protein CGQ27_08015 [Clostridium botulinum]